MPHTTQIQTSCRYWFTLDPVLLSHKEWGTRPQELGSKFSCFPRENFFIIAQEGTNLLHLKIKPPVPLEVLRLHCEISQSNLCLGGTGKDSPMSSLLSGSWEKPLCSTTCNSCSKSSHVCRATSASKSGAIEETPYTPHLLLWGFSSPHHITSHHIASHHITSHHRCEINNFYQMKLYQKIHHRKTMRISTANQHQIHRSKSDINLPNRQCMWSPGSLHLLFPFQTLSRWASQLS